MSQLAVEVQAVTRTYEVAAGAGKGAPRVVEALKGLSFTVEKGQIFGLLGPNGAGKSTLIKILATLLLPTSGHARVLGLDVAQSPFEIRRRINFIFGGERGLYWRLTGRENLELFGALHGLSGKKLSTQIDAVLQKVGLSPEASLRHVETWSKGMKQRLQIAKGLINNPEVLFLDEPTLGLDPVSVQDFRSLIRSLAKDGTSLVLTTHDMSDAQALSDTIGLIKGGRLLECAPTQDLISRFSQNTWVLELGMPRPLPDSFKNKLRLLGAADAALEGDGRGAYQIVLQGDGALIHSLAAELSGLDGLRSVAIRPQTLGEIYIAHVGASG